MDSTEAALSRILGRLREIITAEIYTRASHIPMLAHYTSVAAFSSILRHNELWFSRIRDTNDTSEAIEGADFVADGLKSVASGLFTNYGSFGALDQFEARRELLETDTFVLSLCEHGGDEQADRLIMWQAYGHNGNGLCLVLRKDTLLGQTAKGRFPVHWCPIEYDNAQQIEGRLAQRLRHVADVFDQYADDIKDVPPKVLGSIVASSVVSLVLSHKNPAFAHEKEVRFVRSRLLQELNPPSGCGYRTINRDGTSKSVFVLQLREYPEFPINASLAALLDHIIVGPSNQQNENAASVRRVLTDAGLEHVEVRCSEIPYRANR